ncbi:zinc ribbon domain-containing protein [bacterium]|nr:MAG: zinc ribbon domain-containing protein [bacterium]
MPTYEYRCLDCRKRFEVFMRFSEYGVKAVTCPHCQSSNVQRRIGKVRVARSDESRLSNRPTHPIWPAWTKTRARSVK